MLHGIYLLYQSEWHAVYFAFFPSILALWKPLPLGNYNAVYNYSSQVYYNSVNITCIIFGCFLHACLHVCVIEHVMVGYRDTHPHSKFCGLCYILFSNWSSFNLVFGWLPFVFCLRIFCWWSSTQHWDDRVSWKLLRVLYHKFTVVTGQCGIALASMYFDQCESHSVQP